MWPLNADYNVNENDLIEDDIFDQNFSPYLRDQSQVENMRQYLLIFYLS